MESIAKSDSALLEFMQSRKVLMDAARKHNAALHLQAAALLRGDSARIETVRQSCASLLASAGMTSAAVLVRMNVAPFDDLVRDELAHGGHAQVVLVMSLIREATIALSAISSLKRDDSPEDVELHTAFDYYLGEATKICKKLQDAANVR